MRILKPDHPFIVAVRELDLPRLKELIAEDSSLVDAQVRGGVVLTGNNGREYTAEETDEHAGALHFAAFHGHAELEQLLIDAGADLHAKSYFGLKEATPLTLACWQGDPKVILEAAKAAEIELDLKPGLFTTLAHGGSIKLLMEHGPEYDFYTAAMAGELEELQRLIKEDPNSLDDPHPEYGRTPLEQALMVGQLQSAELLAEQGAEVQPFAAATMGHVPVVKALLEKDGDATQRIYGKANTLLIWAIRGGQIDVVKLVLEHGADPNGGDRWGFTPFYHLHDVSLNDDEVRTIEKLLVDAGGDATVTRN